MGTRFIKCPMCRKEYESVAYSNKITEEQQIKFFKGEDHVQNIFPQLTASERETLISGLCLDCQEKVFGK